MRWRMLLRLLVAMILVLSNIQDFNICSPINEKITLTPRFSRLTARQLVDGTIEILHDCYAPLETLLNLMRIHSKLLMLSTVLILCSDDFRAYMDKVNAGEKKLSAKQFPSMFYDMSLYNPRDKSKGFLRSRIVIQVIFLRSRPTFLMSFVGLEAYIHRPHVCHLERAHWALVKTGEGEDSPFD